MFVSVYLWFIEFGEFLYIGCSVHCFLLCWSVLHIEK